MRLLVLGNSDSGGKRLPDPASAWPRLCARDLEAAIGEPVDLIHKPLFASGPRATGYLDRLLSEHQPDIATVTLFTQSFLLPAVHIKVERRLGARAGRLTLALQQGSERLALRLGAPGRLSYTLLRGGVRKVVGTDTATHFDVAVEAYAGILRRLAREEDLQVVVVLGVRMSHRYHVMVPHLDEGLDRFEEIMRPIAAEHHFGWVDNDAVLRAAGDPEQFYLPDGRHRNAAGHRLLADALVAALAAGHVTAGRAPA